MSPQFDTDLVKQCPVCKRTHWNNSKCNHGQIPEDTKNAPVENPQVDKIDVRPKRERK